MNNRTPTSDKPTERLLNANYEKRLTMITYIDIVKICTEFINDRETTIGMECDWHDYLINQVRHCFNKQDVMAALNVDNSNYAVPVAVNHKIYGDMQVYIAIYENMFEISTKEWLLNDENEYRHVIDWTKRT